MAAIAYPQAPATSSVPTLRLVRSGPLCAPRAVYLRRRVAVAAFALVLLALVVTAAVSLLDSAPASTTVRVGTPTSATGTVLVADPAAFGSSGEALPQGAVYVVRPGDTLWSIARAVAPDADVTETAARLAELNGSSALQVGQRLHLR
jgi:nucleoid-associated protein YgaU